MARRRVGKTSVQPGFGQFDRDPEVDFAQDLVEPVVARTVLEAAGNRLEPQKRRLVEPTRQEAELKLIERIKRPTAMLDRPVAAFQPGPRCLGTRSGRRCRRAIARRPPAVCACDVSLPTAKRRRRRRAGLLAGGSRNCRAVRSDDAHEPEGGPLRLMGGKKVACHPATIAETGKGCAAIGSPRPVVPKQ